MSLAVKVCNPSNQPTPDGPIVAATERLIRSVSELFSRLEPVLKTRVPVPPPPPDDRSDVLRKLEGLGNALADILERLDV